ncbi:MAG: ABC transporter permease [Culturomica sp.]|jgi:ABC-2 type transport system permease protein|nr:ABC transporter permease [Culturomica sp.]
MQSIRNILQIFREEFSTVIRDSGVWIFFVLLNLAYPVIYTYIYSNESVHEVPVAVVDHDFSSASRDFIRRWDASANVNVIARCNDIEEAKRLWYKKDILGILEVPKSFGSDINTGKQTNVSLFTDMGGLLNYKALLMSASSVAQLSGKEIQVKDLTYALPTTQELTASPIRIEEVKLFNPESGYASFIIPAILILVIQQSLLLGIGTLAGTARDRNKGHLLPTGYLTRFRNPFQIITGKAMAYFTVYVVMIVWVYVVVPGIFNLTRIGLKLDLFIFLLPFLLSSIFMAISFSFLSKEREAPFFIFVFTSVPLMFLSGISWPIEAIPHYWKTISHIFPSTFGIEGYTKIANMGSTLNELLPEWYSLWLLTVVYFFISAYLYYRAMRVKF